MAENRFTIGSTVYVNPSNFPTKCPLTLEEKKKQQFKIVGVDEAKDHYFIEMPASWGSGYQEKYKANVSALRKKMLRTEPLFKVGDQVQLENSFFSNPSFQIPNGIDVKNHVFTIIGVYDDFDSDSHLGPYVIEVPKEWGGHEKHKVGGKFGCRIEEVHLKLKEMDLKKKETISDFKTESGAPKADYIASIDFNKATEAITNLTKELEKLNQNSSRLEVTVQQSETQQPIAEEPQLKKESQEPIMSQEMTFNSVAQEAALRTACKKISQLGAAGIAKYIRAHLESKQVYSKKQINNMMAGVAALLETDIGRAAFGALLAEGLRHALPRIPGEATDKVHVYGEKVMKEMYTEATATAMGLVLDSALGFLPDVQKALAVLPDPEPAVTEKKTQSSAKKLTEEEQQLEIVTEKVVLKA